MSYDSFNKCNPYYLNVRTNIILKVYYVKIYGQKLILKECMYIGIKMGTHLDWRNRCM